MLKLCKCPVYGFNKSLHTKKLFNSSLLNNFASSEQAFNTLKFGVSSACSNYTTGVNYTTSRIPYFIIGNTKYFVM